ncbi:MAG: hypothetical protein RSC06_16685 [Clostridia bacterium]
MAAPDVTFSASKTALGVGDFITVSFTSDIAMSAFEARATTFGAAYGVGIGTLVGAFSATPAGVQRTFEIYETELVNGDGQYRISLFAQSAEDGAWNDNYLLIPGGADGLITSDGKQYLCVR